jgi:hypothetical protein
LRAPQLFPRFMALGNVAHDVRKSDELAFLVADGVDHHRRKKHRSILANTPTVLFIGARSGSHCKSVFGSTGDPVRRRVKAREMLADNLTFGIALNPLRPGIPARHDASRIQSNQCVIARSFRKKPELPFAFVQRLGRQLLGCYVTADQIDQSVLCGERPRDPAPGAVLVAKAVFHADGGNAFGKSLAAGHRMSGVIGVPELADMHPLDLVFAPAE